MTEVSAAEKNSSGAAATARRAAFALILALAVARLMGLLSTPLELYPDEAQYWLWSKHPAFGYFSKPPMTAWVIALTTRLGGDAEPYVRAGAVFLNAGTAIVLFHLGRRLYGARNGSGAGALAAALFILMPGVDLASLIISTDTPLLFFASLALLAYAALQDAKDQGARLRAAAGLGAALGLALLSKYAAAYLIAGLGLHAAVEPKARRAWTPAALGLSAGVAALLVAPNIAWNAAHGFQTFSHTASNANLTHGNLFNPLNLLAFLWSQFGVFGPVPLAVLIGGLIIKWRARSLEPADRLLLCAAAPALVAVTVLAFVSRANANWAAAAYAPAAVLVGGWLTGWREDSPGVRRAATALIVAALATQGLAAAGMLAVTLKPRIADQLGLANGLKRVRGWKETARVITERAAVEQTLNGLSAIAVDDRALFFTLRYYGRDYFERDDAAPLRKWSTAGEPPISQAEAEWGLTGADGARVLAVSSYENKRGPMAADFRTTSDPQISRVFLDRKHMRRLDMFVGEGFRQGPPPPPPPAIP